MKSLGILATGFVLIPLCFANSKPDAAEILTKAELIRNPPGGYAVKVELTDHHKGKKEVRKYQTKVKDRERALVDFEEPLTERGTKVLMAGMDMWLSIPSASKPIRIAARQKLTGNAVYGDVTRLDFTHNYTPKYLRDDVWKKSRVWVLELVAIEGRPVTYDKVEYWVEQKTFRPVRVLYQTLSGKTLREGYFADFADVLGVIRPTRFIIVDHFEKAHVTELFFPKTRKADLPEILFEKQNFGRD
jgi:hypothetical protein